MSLISIGTANRPVYVDPLEVTAIGPAERTSENPQETYKGFSQVTLRNVDTPFPSPLHPDAVALRINEALGYLQETEDDKPEPE